MGKRRVFGRAFQNCPGKARDANSSSIWLRASVLPITNQHQADYTGHAYKRYHWRGLPTWTSKSARDSREGATSSLVPAWQHSFVFQSGPTRTLLLLTRGGRNTCMNALVRMGFENISVRKSEVFARHWQKERHTTDRKNNHGDCNFLRRLAAAPG